MFRQLELLAQSQHRFRRRKDLHHQRPPNVTMCPFSFCLLCLHFLLTEVKLDELVSRKDLLVNARPLPAELCSCFSSQGCLLWQKCALDESLRLLGELNNSSSCTFPLFLLLLCSFKKEWPLCRLKEQSLGSRIPQKCASNSSERIILWCMELISFQNFPEGA